MPICTHSSTGCASGPGSISPPTSERPSCAGCSGAWRRPAPQHCRTTGATSERHPEELQRLVASFLIKVTEFFRDPELFTYLRDQVLPGLISEARERGELRIWSAGCATGEEAYTLAMLVSDLLAEGRGGAAGPHLRHRRRQRRGRVCPARHLHPGGAAGSAARFRRAAFHPRRWRIRSSQAGPVAGRVWRARSRQPRAVSPDRPRPLPQRLDLLHPRAATTRASTLRLSRSARAGTWPSARRRPSVPSRSSSRWNSRA